MFRVKFREQFQNGIVEPLAKTALVEYYNLVSDVRGLAVLSLYSTTISYTKEFVDSTGADNLQIFGWLHVGTTKKIIQGFPKCMY